MTKCNNTASCRLPRISVRTRFRVPTRLHCSAFSVFRRIKQLLANNVIYRGLVDTRTFKRARVQSRATISIRLNDYLLTSPQTVSHASGFVDIQYCCTTVLIQPRPLHKTVRPSVRIYSGNSIFVIFFSIQNFLKVEGFSNHCKTKANYIHYAPNTFYIIY